MFWRALIFFKVNYRRLKQKGRQRYAWLVKSRIALYSDACERPRFLQRLWDPLNSPWNIQSHTSWVISTLILITKIGKVKFVRVNFAGNTYWVKDEPQYYTSVTFSWVYACEKRPCKKSLTETLGFPPFKKPVIKPVVGCRTWPLRISCWAFLCIERSVSFLINYILDTLIICAQQSHSKIPHHPPSS